MYFQRRVSYFCIIYTLVSYPIVYKYNTYRVKFISRCYSDCCATFRSTVVRLRDFSRVGSFLSALQHIFFVGNLCAHYLRTSVAHCCAARVALRSLRRTPKRSVFTFGFYPKFAITTCFRMSACSQPGCVYAPVNKANPFSTLCFSIFSFACYILHQ